MQLSQLFSRIFWILALILLGIGLVFGIERIVFSLGSESASGEIIEVRVAQNEVPMMAKGTGLHYYPLIRFLAPNGQSVEFESPAGLTGLNYEVGQTVGVRFLPGQPSRAYLDSTWGLYGLPIILLGTGALFLLFGFVAGKGFDRKKY